MYTIEGCYHVSHCVPDLGAADEWYQRVLGAHLIEKNYVESALRDASFWVVGDYVWEVVCPADRPGAGQAPLGRFLGRYGPRLHSFSWWVDDPAACAATLTEAGARVVDVAGAAVDPPSVGRDAALFTHPRDTFGMLEFAGPECTPEMRMPIAGSPPITHWSAEHPLGIERVDRMVVVVEDLDQAVETFGRCVGGREVGRLDRPGRSLGRVLAVGPTRVELRRPDDPDSPEARWLAKNGAGSYSVAFAVRDVAAAQSFLREQGLRPERVDERTVVVDPATSLEVAFEFGSGR